jgi:hypothetical protein
MLDRTPTLSGNGWDAYGAWRYGTEPIEQAGGRAHIPHVQSSAIPSAPPWSPQNPLFWFAALLLATGAGLFGVSGSVKVGKTTAAAEIGKS